MIIDTVYVLLLALAVMKGYRKGFVIAIFSFAAWIIGLIAAMKLSAIVANWLGEQTNISKAWLPVLAFAIVMIGVGLLIRWCALLIQKTLQLAMLGFLNKLAGILLYAALFTVLLSIVLFYAKEINLVKPETIAASHFYNFIQPWGPKLINSLGVILPFVKNIIKQLEHFFEQIAAREQHA